LTWDERTTRQRLGLRQPSAAFPPQDERRKAAEGCRSPRPRGTFKRVGKTIVVGNSQICFHKIMTAKTTAKTIAHSVMLWSKTQLGEIEKSKF
jgi:hypothetical protein